MKVFLAGSGWSDRLWIKEGFFDFNRLESFYTMEKKEIPYLSSYNDFLFSLNHHRSRSSRISRAAMTQ